MPRIACLHVPSFPLAAWLRAEPELCGGRVAVAEGRGPRARIVAVSSEAQRRGITAGLSAAQALAIDADLLLRPVSPDAERAAQAALCDVADSFSPRVEDAAPGLAFLDASGSQALFDSEGKLATALSSTAQSLGLPAGVGIGSTKITARLAAEHGGVCVLPSEDEWRFLEPLPLELLQPDAQAHETLRRWGIRTLGQLAALPAAEVASRLGPHGSLLVRRARGEDERPLNVRAASLCFEESVEADYGIESLEPFLFLLRQLLDRLIPRLSLRGLTCGDLRLSLRLANRARVDRTVVVAAPSNDPKALLTLLRLHLEKYPPPAAVERIGLAAVPERLRAMQLDLFRPKGPAPEKLALVLARLTALCGEDRVGRPVVVDSHRPDAYGVAPFDADAARSDHIVAEAAAEYRPLAVRAVRPARKLEVFTQRERLEFVRPASDSSNNSSVPAAPRVSTVTNETSPPRGTEVRNHFSCTGRVVSAAGPWRVQGEWWHDGAYLRDYYDVQLSDGGLYRLYFDRRAGEWFVDGLYD